MRLVANGCLRRKRKVSVEGYSIAFHKGIFAPHKESLRGYGHELNLTDPQSDIEYKLQWLLEYSDLFPGKSLDVKEEIKNFSREELIKMVLVLGKNYGACKISDMEEKPFFSYLSDLYEQRMKAIYAYIIKNNTTPDNVSYACQRTFLEFLKLIFGTSIECFKPKYQGYIAEVKLFDILLALNEQKVTKFVPSKHKKNDFARLMYVSLYATNEFTNLNFYLEAAEQLYYCDTFFKFITSRKEYKHIYQAFLDKFEICNWKEYVRTLAMLTAMVYKNGEGSIKLEKNNPDALLNRNVLNHILIEEDGFIEIDDNVCDENRDFVQFRSCPLIHLKNGDYLLYNKQLIVDRLYNSIYFDLLPLKLKYNKKSFGQLFKEVFVEKFLFDQTMLKCLEDRRLDTCFPKLNDIQKVDFCDGKEDEDQPDFYFREGNDIFIFECKAVKLNGELKSRADVDEIMAELKNKLVEKSWKGSYKQQIPTEAKPEGIGQLVNHIYRLEKNTFKWDAINSERLNYYPVLVLESYEIALPQLSAIANEWYQERLNTIDVEVSKCKPLIVMTIKTLFLFDNIFKSKGFKNVFDQFIDSHTLINNIGVEEMSPFENIDDWMLNKFKNNKQSYFMSIVERLKKQQ